MRTVHDPVFPTVCMAFYLVIILVFFARGDYIVAGIGFLHWLLIASGPVLTLYRDTKALISKILKSRSSAH